MTLEQRREKLKSLKAKSKCMRCGALGHWAGDPECKFPSQGGGKGKAHLAVIADEGLSIPAGNDSAAAFVARARISFIPMLTQVKLLITSFHDHLSRFTARCCNGLRGCCRGCSRGLQEDRVHSMADGPE